MNNKNVNSLNKRWQILSLVLLSFGIGNFVGCRGEHTNAKKNDLKNKEKSTIEGPAKQILEGDKKYFLYKVSKEDKISYILGTIPSGIQLDYLAPEIYSQFKSCSKILLSEDREQFKKKFSNDISRSRWLPQNENIESYLSSSAISKLESLFPDETNREKIKKMKAFSIQSFISKLVEVKLKEKSNQEWDISKSIESDLLQRAQKENQSIVYLEDLNLKLNEWEESYTFDDLEKSLAASDPIEKGISCRESLQKAYLSGPVDNFKDYYAEDCETETFVKILNKKSQNWLTPLNSAFTEGSACAAFDARHLEGPEGVIEGLKKEGFNIEVISSGDLKI